MSTRCVVLMLPALVWTSVASTTARPSDTVFPEARLERALESGCSLVIAEVLEVYARDRMHYYKPRVVRTIIAGDLEKGEIHNPPDLFAGASYGTALKPGSFYAMFISRDYPYEFGWAFRDDVIEVNPSDEETIRRLVETADRIYAATSIRQFRRTRPWAYVKPPDLPDELALLCKQFREQPGRRTELGKRIAESDLGSQRDSSDILSSIIRYLPPKISLSRRQVLSLLGEPRWRSGWTYSWSCDHYVSAQEGGEQIGLLSVTFDRNEMATCVLFDMQERSKWIRPARSDEWFASLDGDPGAVARGFLEALRQSNWERALSFCSPSVEAKARQLDSIETFFRRFVPVEKLTTLHQFDPRGFGSRDGKVVNVSSEVHIDTPKARWPVQWNWALVRAGAAWLVDFELVSLEDFIQKELIKSEMINDSAARRRWESHEGIRYVLMPTTAGFVLGQPMPLRLEMRNDGTEPVGYMRMSVMLNDPLLVTGPDGETLPYMDTSYQTMVGSDAILPGEVIVLADAYDVTSQYHIVRPGRYTFRFRGTRPGGKSSNMCEVDVKPGPLSDVETIVERLLPILPAGWRFTRHMASQNDDDPQSSGLLYVHMIGQPGGKGGDKGVLLMIPMYGDPAETDPWLKESFDLWGLSPWGPVYASVRDADALWPDHKTEVSRVLNIQGAARVDIIDLIQKATHITKNGASEREAQRKLVEMGEQVVPPVIEWLELEEAKGGTTGRWNSYTHMVDVLSQIGTPKAREYLTPERAHGSLLGSQAYRAILLKRVEVWQSKDRFERLIEMLDGAHQECKWAVFKLSVLADIRAIGPLDRIAADSKGVDIRETAKDALAHLRDPNVPVRYIDHLPSQDIELTVPTEGYRVGEPIAVRCKITGGQYGSQSLVHFSKPDWQFLPWGLSPPNLDRSQPFSLTMYRKRGRGYDRVNAIRQLRPADQSVLGKDGEPASLYVDAADFGAIDRFDLKPGESRLYEFADIGQAFPMTEPGEYRIHVSSYGLALSDFVNIHIRPAATDPSSSP